MGTEHRLSERDPFHQSNDWPNSDPAEFRIYPIGCWLQRAVSKLLLTNEAQTLCKTQRSPDMGPSYPALKKISSFSVSGNEVSQKVEIGSMGCVYVCEKAPFKVY